MIYMPNGEATQLSAVYNLQYFRILSSLNFILPQESQIRAIINNNSCCSSRTALKHKQIESVQMCEIISVQVLNNCQDVSLYSLQQYTIILQICQKEL